MGSRYECFWLEPTSKAVDFFCRYSPVRYLRNSDGTLVKNAKGSAIIDESHNRSCAAGKSYCNAVNTGGIVELRNEPSVMSFSPPDELRDDIRWPTKCEYCEEEFAEDDAWQSGQRKLFERKDTGELVTLNDAPYGAMWNADWFDYKTLDGLVIVVKTPGGDWVVDGPCRDGTGWQRSGNPPKITVRPSIGIGQGRKRRWLYHGFLTNGVLEACGDSET